MPTPKIKIKDRYLVKPIADYTPIELLASTVPWTDDDFAALQKAAEEIKASPYDFITVLMSESMLNPQSVTYGDKAQKIIGIVGLNQMTQDAVIGTFYPEMVDPTTGQKKPGAFKKWQEFAHAFYDMTAAEQFPYIVKMINKGLWRKKKPDTPFPNARTLYLTNFQPGLGLVTDPKYVIYKNPNPGTSCPKGDQSPYCQNSGMDKDKDGKITIGDLDLFLNRADVVQSERYNALMRRYKEWEAGQKTVIPPTPNVPIPNLPTPVSDISKPLDTAADMVKKKLAPSLAEVPPAELGSFLGGVVPKDLADSIPGFPGGALPAVPGLDAIPAIPGFPGFATSGEGESSNAKYVFGAIAAGAIATGLYFAMKKSDNVPVSRTRSREDEIAERYIRQLQMRGAYS